MAGKGNRGGPSKRSAKQLGGADGVARQHAKGRKTIRERIDGLLDEGSFQELGMGAGGAYRDENGEITEFLPAISYSVLVKWMAAIA